MSIQTPGYPAYIDDQPVQDTALAALAFSGFAHFTAMQARARQVKAMDLHLKRLRDASITLFGTALADAAILDGIRRALEEGPANMSLTVTVYPTQGEFSAASMGGELAFLVRTGPPFDGPAGPLRLALVEHERHLAGIKHVGEGAKTWYLHQAVKHGFDDALFVDRQGRLAEGTIWNLALWDGETIVWPRADILAGTMMGMVQRQLSRMGVPQRQRELRPADLTGMRGAALMNSWTPGVAVTAIGEQAMPRADDFMALLRQAFDAEPAVPV